MKPRIQLRKNIAGEWFWRVVARNGRLVCTAGESFATRRGAQKAVRRAREIMAEAEYDAR